MTFGWIRLTVIERSPIDGNTDIEESPDTVLMWMASIHKWGYFRDLQGTKNTQDNERMPLNFIV